MSDRTARIFVVLGMHKSGTTLLARMLHESGIRMLPEHQDGQRGYDQGGTFEWDAFKAINRNLLRSRGRGSLAIDLGRPLSVLETDRIRGQTLISHVNTRFRVWGFKDPCTTLTYPFWRDLLPAHTIVAIYRSPRSVIAHYGRQRNRLIGQSLRHWIEYNRRLIEYLAKPNISGILVNFDDLMMDDNEWRALEEFLDRPMLDVRDSSLYRFRASSPQPENFSAFTKDCEVMWHRLQTVHRQQWQIRRR